MEVVDADEPSPRARRRARPRDGYETLLGRGSMFDRSREEAARQESYEYERAISMSNAQVTGGQDYDYLKSELADRKKAIMRRKEAEDAAEAESMAEVGCAPLAWVGCGPNSCCLPVSGFEAFG